MCRQAPPTVLAEIFIESFSAYAIAHSIAWRREYFLHRLTAIIASNFTIQEKIRK
jgi:hypothetical protein